VWKICHKAGEWVKAGEKVIQLDDTQLQLSVKTAQSSLAAARIDLSTGEDTTTQANPKLAMQVRSAQAALAAAQKNYDAQKALVELGGATGTQVDTAQSDLQTAQANLEAAKTALDQNVKAPAQNLAQLKIAVEKAENALQQAQVNLQYAGIQAPFSGQIAAIDVNPGEYVQASTTAFSLVSSEREIHFTVPPAHARLLPVGTKLTFTNEGASYPVTVKLTPSSPINGMVPMVASVAPSYSPAFGSVGTVSYSLSLAKGVLIPIAALKTSEDKNYVFAVEGGKAVRRAIVVAAESGVTAAITGVASGSQVIVNPPPGLLDGASVQPVATGSDGAEAQQK
jgi:multidrug efflux pump subunit AcrA (membrane-fusion protein)